MTKHYVDKNGNYLGGFDGGAPTVAYIAVSVPVDGRQKYDIVNKKWLPLDVNIASLSVIANIESSMTPRRLREFTRGTDNGWWKSKEDEILRLEIILGRA